MSSEAEAQSGPPTDVGARLRAAREAKQITLREIATTTKISVGTLEALEENDVARLPGGIFTRAFVKAYASEVGLDPEATMRDFMAQVPSESATTVKLDPRAHEHDLFQSQQRMAGAVLKLLLVGVPLAGLLLFFGMRGGPADDLEPTEESAEVTAPAAPVPTAPVSAPAPTPVTRDAPAEPAEVVASPLSLRLHPSGDCWVSLTIDGDLVFARVMEGGEQESYEANDEIVLTVGDAGAFGYSINQQPGRPLGAPGEVRTARITPETVDGFVAP